jgi:hypothetical protein
MFGWSVSSLSQAELIKNSLRGHAPFERLNAASLLSQAWHGNGDTILILFVYHIS